MVMALLAPGLYRCAGVAAGRAPDVGVACGRTVGVARAAGVAAAGEGGVTADGAATAGAPPRACPAVLAAAACSESKGSTLLVLSSRMTLSSPGRMRSMLSR